MKKLALLTLLFCILCASIYATDLSIQAITTIPWSDNRTSSLELWVFADQAWIDIDGTPHGAGNYRDRIFTQRVSGLTNNTTTHKLTIPAFSLTPTLNAIRGNSVRLSFWIMQVIGQNVTPIKQVPNTENGFRIPATLTSASGCSPSPTCATWADLTVLNTPSPSLPRETFPTFNDVTRIIIAALGTAQGPAGTSGLQYKNGEVFGELTGSSFNGTELNLGGSAVRIGLFDSGATLRVGPSSQRLTLDPASTDISGATNTGGAPLLFQPTFHYTSGADFRSVGVAVKPSFGSTTGGEAIFWTPYWFLFGSSAVPIPAGTKGNPSGFEANIFTAQASADMSEAAHAFGATIVGSGGAPLYGAAISLTVNTVAANVRVYNADIAKNVAGGIQNVFYASSSGSQVPTAVGGIGGTWSKGWDFSSGVFQVAPLYFANGQTVFAARNPGNTADQTLLLVNAAGEVEVGNNFVNQLADPIFRLGTTSLGVSIQKIDSPISIRFFSHATGANMFQVDATGQVYLTAILLANLVNVNGSFAYCSDCTNASNPCTGSGTGAIAKRLNGAWDCR